MSHLIAIILFIGISTSSAFAADCPWVNKKGNDLLSFDFYADKVVSLSKDQVQEDLLCLKIVLSQFYAYHVTYPNNEIENRVEKAISNAKPMLSTELIDQIFSFHTGYVDIHLSYQGGNIDKRFKKQKPVTVKLSEELAEEQILERSQYTYFKPGKLLPKLTDAQQKFINYVVKNDRPLVIDLRGNRGGDNTLAFALIDVLFTKDQHVPGSTVTQITGGMPYIGQCVTTSIVYGDAVKNFCNQVKQFFGDLPFSQLLSKQLEVEVREFKGKREKQYLSPIFLITDSLCASACETIVEKISALPNVKTVGSHTGGALHFGNMMSFVLPNSGIWIAIPSRAETYENQAAEGVGYAPNIDSESIDLDKLFDPL